MTALLELHGLRPNRQGFLRCPFHSGDRTPSMKVYPNGRGWVCFGCHKGGDVINLARCLYDTDYKGAVSRLNADFHLGLEKDTRTENERRSDNLALWKRRRAAAQAEERYQRDVAEWALCNALIHAWTANEYDPDAIAEAMARRDYLTYRLQEYEKGGDV